MYYNICMYVLQKFNEDDLNKGRVASQNCILYIVNFQQNDLQPGRLFVWAKRIPTFWTVKISNKWMYFWSLLRSPHILFYDCNIYCKLRNMVHNVQCVMENCFCGSLLFVQYGCVTCCGVAFLFSGAKVFVCFCCSVSGEPSWWHVGCSAWVLTGARWCLKLCLVKLF